MTYSAPAATRLSEFAPVNRPTASNPAVARQLHVAGQITHQDAGCREVFKKYSEAFGDQPRMFLLGNAFAKFCTQRKIVVIGQANPSETVADSLIRVVAGDHYHVA